MNKYFKLRYFLKSAFHQQRTLTLLLGLNILLSTPKEPERKVALTIWVQCGDIIGQP
jgi:hypothetical protein